MEHPRKPFQSPQEIERLGQQFGSPGDIQARMRPCDDVPRFIRKIENAHQQTTHSKLRFGPGSSDATRDP